MRLPTSTIISAALLLAQAPAADIAGTWDLTMEFGDVKSTGSCTFRHDGDKLAGSCGAGAEQFPLTGTVDGQRVSWTFDVKQQGVEGRMEFAGQVDDGNTRINGSCLVVTATGGPGCLFTMMKK